ncbi:MAG: hypothetical protein LBQ21_05010 [Clostridiales Family XIII bacterium]|nr:hypothetical protein [Clostridiales Family XIII bacterium]
MKKLSILLVVALIIMAFAGCGTPADEGSDTTDTPAATETPDIDAVELPAGEVMSKGPHGEEASSAADL